MISAKVMLLSTGALSAAVALGLSAPAMSAKAPRIYRALLVWLTPPYLYLVVNGIIISIAASSRFRKPDVQEEEDGVLRIPPLKASIEHRPEEPPAPVVFEVGGGSEEEEKEERQEGLLLLPERYSGEKDGAGGEAMIARERTATEEEAEEEEEEEFVISPSTWTPGMRGRAAEKPPVSSRFGVRRNVKASPEGKALGVAKPRRYETLESTWRTITDGRSIPLARHLKKSETWGGGAREAREEATPPMRKAEAFRERQGASPSASPGVSKGRLLRREPSPGQDELNRRVEAFIRNFNEEMRLQRQESFQSYMDMINGGTR